MKYAKRNKPKNPQLIKHKLIDKGPMYSYFARSDGYIIRCLNSNFKEEVVKPWFRRGALEVKVNQKDRVLKHIIAEAFMPGYKKGMCIENIDGDPYNCSIKNLRAYSYSEHGRNSGYKTSKSKPCLVMSPDGRLTHYRSIRAAAQALFCSYQTLADYINHKSKNSILEGYIIKLES